MTITARAIIQSALEWTGVYAPGEPQTDADAELGLTILNDMVDEWASAYVPIFQLTPFTTVLTGGTAQYAATIDHPIRVLNGPGAGTVTIGGATTSVDVVSALEWTAIWSINPGSGVPAKAFFDQQWPNGVLNVAPTPPSAGTMTLSYYQALASFPILDTAYTLSPATNDALRANLAVMLKPYFSGAVVDPTIIQAATASKKFMSLQNIRSRAVPARVRSAAQPAAAQQ